MHIKLEDGSPEGLQDFPADFNVPGIVNMHYNGSREVILSGREGKVLHAVYIRLEGGSPEGLQDLPSDLNVPGIVDMHYNASREVKQNGREGWPLHVGHIRLEDSSPEGLQDFPSDFNVPGIVHNSWPYYELGHHSVCDFTTGTIMNCEAMRLIHSTAQ